METPLIGRPASIRCQSSRSPFLAAALLFAATLLAGSLSPAWAQSDSVVEEIVVTGYRGSLLNSTDAKRNSVGFTDEIFADDIGKLPSQNLAESLNRIPRVKISRDASTANFCRRSMPRTTPRSRSRWG